MGVVAVVCLVAPLDIAVPGVVESVVEPEMIQVEMSPNSISVFALPSAQPNNSICAVTAVSERTRQNVNRMLVTSTRGVTKKNVLMTDEDVAVRRMG
jgi:hypothetical protein